MAKASAGLARARALAKTSYAASKKAAEAKVVRWEWATNQRHSPEPAYFEGRNQSPGRRLAQAPTTWKYQAHEGFDDAGRIVVLRGRTSLRNRQYETFFDYDDDGVAQLYFDYDTPKRWISAIWYSLKGGRVVAHDAVYRIGSQYSRVYHYNAKGWLLGYDERGVSEYKETVRHGFDFDHDRTGKLIRAWWRYADGTRTRYWQHRSVKQR